MGELGFPIELVPLFFLVALLYSSVGHGGASGYLALFALFGVVSPAIVPVALVLNIIVAGTSWWRYARGGMFSWKAAAPFVVCSIPAAFLGGLISIPQQVFSFLLGLALLFAAVRLLISNEIVAERSSDASRYAWKWGVPIGGGLGFLSGMIGIGGGVFLSPLLLFLRWADVKRTAAISSVFIVLNSVSGLGGHLTRANVDFSVVIPFGIVVFVGGFLGSQLGVVRLQQRTLQAVLAVVLIVAGTKLVSNLLFA